MTRPLVLAAHGTADPQGQAVVRQVAADAAAVLGVEHRVGFVDVCGPTLAEALAVLAPAAGSDARAAGAGPAPVVVPFFLASGYHVRHDVPAAVRELGHDPLAVVTPALGVEPEVVTALVERVLEAEAAPAALVLVSAGSSVEGARGEVADLADRVGERLGIPADVAFLSGPGPRPAEVSATVGERPVVLAAHLLAPGHFLGLAHRAAEQHGAAATGALGTHPALTDLVVRRYRKLLPG